METQHIWVVVEERVDGAEHDAIATEILKAFLKETDARAYVAKLTAQYREERAQGGVHAVALGRLTYSTYPVELVQS